MERSIRRFEFLILARLGRVNFGFLSAGTVADRASGFVFLGNE
jgi:hypothetical protein